MGPPASPTGSRLRAGGARGPAGWSLGACRCRRALHLPDTPPLLGPPMPPAPSSPAPPARHGLGRRSGGRGGRGGGGGASPAAACSRLRGPPQPPSARWSGLHVGGGVECEVVAAPRPCGSSPFWTARGLRRVSTRRRGAGGAERGGEGRPRPQRRTLTNARARPHSNAQLLARRGPRLAGSVDDGHPPHHQPSLAAPCDYEMRVWRATEPRGRGGPAVWKSRRQRRPPALARADSRFRGWGGRQGCKENRRGCGAAARQRTSVRAPSGSIWVPAGASRVLRWPPRVPASLAGFLSPGAPPQVRSPPRSSKHLRARSSPPAGRSRPV